MIDLVEFMEQYIFRADCKVILGSSPRRWVAPLTLLLFTGQLYLEKCIHHHPSPLDPIKTPLPLLFCPRQLSHPPGVSCCQSLINDEKYLTYSYSSPRNRTDHIIGRSHYTNENADLVQTLLRILRLSQQSIRLTQPSWACTGHTAVKPASLRFWKRPLTSPPSVLAARPWAAYQRVFRSRVPDCFRKQDLRTILAIEV